MYQVNDDFRAAMFWAFNDNMNSERLEKQMDVVLNAGVNCGFFHTRVGLVTPYMSEEWLDVIEKNCENVRRRGTQAWLYDEDRFPSGYGGGRVTQNRPDLAGMVLALAPEEELATENVVGRFGEVERDGKKYVFAAIQQRNGEFAWFTGGAYIDTLNPESAQEFLRCIHEKYAQRLGDYMGKELKGVFFDEPAYIRYIRFKCVPFTLDFPEAFEKKYGYSLEENLPKLFFDEGDYHPFRLDYYTLAAERFVEAFTVTYQKWCTEHNFTLTGHYVHEDTPTLQTEHIGSAMLHYAEMDIPGIDILGVGNQRLPTVLQVASVAEQQGKVSCCEALSCIGHQRGPQEMKSVTDWLNVLGVSMMIPHIMLYSMRGERKRDYPSNISWMQPWFDLGKGYFDHIARMSEACQAGRSMVDLLMIHPLSSVWAEYAPAHRKYNNGSVWDDTNPHWRSNFPTESQCFEKPFFELSNGLYARGLAHHYGDELLMAKMARVEDGKLWIGRQAYSKVVVPPVSVLRSTTMELLRQLAEQAGPDSVVFVERYPEWICGGDMPEMQGWNKLYPSVAEAMKRMEEGAGSRVRVVDRTTGLPAGTIFSNVREWEGKPLVLFSNIGSHAVNARIYLPYKDLPAVADTATGEIYSLPAGREGDEWYVDVNMRPSASLLLVPTYGPYPVAHLLKSGADFRGKMRFISAVHPEQQPQAENLLAIDRVSFRTKDFSVEDAPLETLWNRFYALEEGTEFEAEYRFEVAEVPEDACAMIEMARNLESIEFNGEPAEILETEAEIGPFDFSFDRVALKNMKPGCNTLVLRGRKVNNVISMANHVSVAEPEKHHPTELECVFIMGKFLVELNGAYPVITAPADKVPAGDITKAGYPFYSGAVAFEVEIPEGAKWLRVDASANACRISAEGVEDAEFMAPYSFDLSAFVKAGVKRIKVELRNSLANTFGPLHLRGREELWMLGPALIYDMKRYQPEYVLIPYGCHSITFFGEEC